MTSRTFKGNDVQKTVFEETITVIDENHEIKKFKQTKTVVKSKEPAYVKFYVDDLSRLLQVPKSGNFVLYALVKRMNYEGYVTVTKSTKERISAEIGVKPQAISNMLVTLSKIGLIKRQNFCEYELNPSLFAKGEWSDIEQRIQDFEMKITYTMGGKRTIKTRALAPTT